MGSLLVLLTKSLSCNVAVIIRDVVYFRVFKSISEKLFQVFKEDSVQILTQRSRILCFRLDGPVMCPDAYQCREALNSSRLHPSRCHGNTSGRSSEFEKILALLCRHGLGRQLAPVQTQRSLIRKLHAYILHPSGRQGNTVWTRSLLWNYLQIECNRPNSRATPFGHGLNMEIREVRYEKQVAQLTVQTLNASILMPLREIKDRLNLGLLSL
jgi:hypothetical protein